MFLERAVRTGAFETSIDNHLDLLWNATFSILDEIVKLYLLTRSMKMAADMIGEYVEMK